ncbi:sulfite exporter TauE/SafE family protein [Sphingomonas sp. G124]|uniref:Probable membrane transporter protein n=1 Tax=Sphingomonas cremea TaxID=2904799 RepID=A0A9X1TZ66_9SPHN|nr:TSUP family transporter [Sphingomonas cremea]MCF2515527.1 sulfite exporter TauE/SafE family protein [Sphingomonas cremea]
MLLVLLVAGLTIGAAGLFVGIIREAAKKNQLVPKGEALALAAVTNFFDTLGIGSFAPTLAWFKFRKLVPDRLMPLTMFIGYTIPAILQGVIFLILLGVKVDLLLLTGCVIAIVAGGYIGVPIAARSPVRLIQAIVGFALLIAALFYSLSNLGLMPPGGSASGLPPTLAIIAIIANFIFGILLSFGVGNYAPTLAMLSLMGMDPRLAFPIMAAGAGFSGIAAGVQCVRKVDLDWRIVLGLTIGAIPSVLVAALIVKEMDLVLLRWLVVVVVTYAGVVLLMTALRKAELVPPDAAEAAVTH